MGRVEHDRSTEIVGIREKVRKTGKNKEEGEEREKHCGFSMLYYKRYALMSIIHMLVPNNSKSQHELNVDEIAS